MPRFPKGFGRRKTLAPPDKTNENQIEQSFKVFDRSEGAGKSFDGGSGLFKPVPATVGRKNSKQTDDYNLFENVRSNHSGASNTLTSATDNSSRLSATSTVPSSTDNTNGQEWSSPHDKPFINIPLPPAPRKSSVFSLKNAGHAMSIGKLKTSSIRDIPPPSPSERSDEEITGARMMMATSSCYASTNVPMKPNEKVGDCGFEGKFSQTFSESQETGKRLKRPDSLLSSTNHSQSYPAPLDIVKTKVIEVSPALSSGYNSSEALIHGNNSAAFESRQSPRSPLVPHHVPLRGSSPLSSHINEQRLERQLEDETKRRSNSTDRNLVSDPHAMSSDEDAQLLQESINASRRLNEQSQDGLDDLAVSQPSSERFNNTERATESYDRSGYGMGTRQNPSDDNMLDSTIAARANLVHRYQERSISPPTSRSPHIKVMTPAQFERYKQDQDRLRNLRFKNSQIDGDEEEDDTNYDDGDDDDAIEKAKAVAKQRRKQEAHMAVYRQQMMKVIGETSGNSTTRPSVFASQSSPNLSNIGQPDETEEEEDEEVPLGILQAHGFPSKSKTPQIRSNRSSSNLKAAAGSAAPTGVTDPRLPVFARNLPHDPYYGSSIVKSMHRESLAFAGGSSPNNGVIKGLPPGGLVGVIATEERSRALRRGSPNAQGEYPVQAPPNQIGVGQNSNELPCNMHSFIGPGNPANTGANPSMLNPVDQAQMHMTHQMQQFMQMQMQFMQMMSQRRPPSPNHVPQSPSFAPHPPELPRPASAQLHQRSLTMMNHNSAPWLNRASSYSPSVYAVNGYAPSIAPSERSNVGLPGRYRPVSQAPPINSNRAKASSVCGDLQNWDEKKASRASKTIHLVDSKPENVSDEDEDEAWAKLAMKKKEKKSAWRTKRDRDSNGLKEMLNYLN